ncbi:MAG: chemotaxis protein CheX [Arenicella sp.]
MIEDKLKVFVDNASHYFTYNLGDGVVVGSPYLINSMEELKGDYTGIISISGAYNGTCCFIAPSILLKSLLQLFGRCDTSEHMLFDAVGEVANTLSGNARKELGGDFIISVPIVIKGSPKDEFLQAKSRTYAIPITWNSCDATLGVSLS